LNSSPCLRRLVVIIADRAGKPPTARRAIVAIAAAMGWGHRTVLFSYLDVRLPKKRSPHERRLDRGRF
jgi:hypothetical protein